MNPPKSLCGICHRSILDNCKSIYCSNCHYWVHIRCNNISNAEYKSILNKATYVSWFCIKCTKILFPFGQLDNEELLNLYEASFPSLADSLPSFEIVSGLSNLPNLEDYDVDEHLPSNINSNYYTLKELSTLTASHNDLSLLHMNIRSLPLHYDELVATLSSLNISFDIIGLSETWHSSGSSIDINVEIPDYSYFTYKSQSQNGGVALYVKRSLSPIPRLDLGKDNVDFEAVWVEVDNKTEKNYLFCCAYHHPNSSISTFNDYLQEILSLPSVCSKQIFILGDFNINLLNYDTNIQTTNFVNFLFCKQFLPYIVHPTRVTEHSSTLIDNIFSNTTHNETLSGNILTQITDHFPQFLIVKHADISYKTASYFQHDFSKLNAGNLLDDFGNLDLDYLRDNLLDVNSKFNKFLSSLDILVKNHAPLKKLSKRDMKFRNKPWINNKIQKMMRIRDRLFHKIKRDNDTPLKDLYKKFRNRVSKSLKECKASYFYNYFQRNSNNMKQLWSGIKSVIVTRKSSNADIISKIKDSNGNVTTDPTVIASIFNKYFVNVSHSITSTIPRTLVQHEKAATFLDILKSFFFRPTLVRV